MHVRYFVIQRLFSWNHGLAFTIMHFIIIRALRTLANENNILWILNMNKIMAFLLPGHSWISLSVDPLVHSRSKQSHSSWFRSLSESSWLSSPWINIEQYISIHFTECSKFNQFGTLSRLLFYDTILYQAILHVPREPRVIVGSMNMGYDIYSLIRHCQDSNSLWTNF